jgi:hypothetical protein
MRECEMTDATAQPSPISGPATPTIQFLMMLRVRLQNSEAEMQPTESPGFQDPPKAGRCGPSTRISIRYTFLR